MTYFAKIATQNILNKYIVTSVIRADQEFVDTQSGTWILTDYNTYGNVHYAPSPPAEPNTPDGLPAIRANYAGVGFTYDSLNDVFYAPMPTDPGTWVLNTSTWLWEDTTPPKA